VLGAQTEGMIGYVLEQELGNLLPGEVPFATILTMVEVEPSDPAFGYPTKFVGPVYTKPQADQLAADKGWVFKPDRDRWRRVVPSPEPKRIFEIRPIRWLLDNDVIVICAGGGGVPTMYAPDERTLVGVEAVIDKDLASQLLAREVGADLFVMATDVDGVYTGWGTPGQRRLGRVTPNELRKLAFAAGSMARRSRRRSGSSKARASRPRSVWAWLRSRRSWTAKRDPGGPLVIAVPREWRDDGRVRKPPSTWVGRRSASRGLDPTPRACWPHRCEALVRWQPGFPSDFPPPDAGPRGSGRYGQGRRVTAEAVDRPFVHVTSDDRGQVGI
jgi:hypothetical protein